MTRSCKKGMITLVFKTDTSGDHRNQQWSDRVGGSVYSADLGGLDSAVCGQNACGAENFCAGGDGGFRYTFWGIFQCIQ